MEKLWKTSEVLQMLPVSRKALLEMAHRGEIPAIVIPMNKKGRKQFRYFFRPAAVRSWLNKYDSELGRCFISERFSV